MSPSRATVPGCVLHQEVHKIRCPLAPGADLLAADELDRDVVHDEAQLAALPPQGASIEAHLRIVFAALAVFRWIEAGPAGRSRSSCVPPARYRTVHIQAGEHPHRRRPQPDDLRQALKEGAPVLALPTLYRPHLGS
jgi:hypothetical protein